MSPSLAMTKAFTVSYTIFILAHRLLQHSSLLILSVTATRTNMRHFNHLQQELWVILPNPLRALRGCCAKGLGTLYHCMSSNNSMLQIRKLSLGEHGSSAQRHGSRIRSSEAVKRSIHSFIHVHNIFIHSSLSGMFSIPETARSSLSANKLEVVPVSIHLHILFYNYCSQIRYQIVVQCGTATWLTGNQTLWSDGFWHPSVQTKRKP